MKLLPCPFCGGEPEEDGGMFFEFYGHERQDYSIACKKCRAEVRCDVGEHEGADAPCSCHHDTRKICAEKWNRRAAMLQGAERVTTANKLPDGWVACSERLPENKPGSYEYLVFEGLNNRVQHDYWNVPDAGDDCQFTPFWNHYGRYVTHWMPLPAAPKQEVTQALAKGMERYGDAMLKLAKKEDIDG